MGVNYTIAQVRRSRLIMPANSAKFVEKAWQRNADAIVLDLEDSVPIAEKAATRRQIREQVAMAGKGGSDVLVRVNNDRRWLWDDVEAAVWPEVVGIVLPKVESGVELLQVEQQIARLESERGIPTGQIKISVLIESCLGFLRMDEIAGSSERIDSLTLGNEDFLRDAGIQDCADTFQALLQPRMQLLFTARAHAKTPMGLLGSLAHYNDAEAFAKSAELAYKHGFLGASCIHPGNVEILNRAFSPSTAENETAGRIIEAFEAAVAQGRASTTFEGKMIDYVHYERAKKLFQRAAAIQAFELKKRQARQSQGL
ncbi:MAG: CoA ester lyase [Veillonellaceae bacterium]|jgi:citrate lyase subunit beta/citryl-CoA lyase|nr:CoA ester lyase [Veillonellaceae bacterium]